MTDEEIVQAALKSQANFPKPKLPLSYKILRFMAKILHRAADKCALKAMEIKSKNDDGIYS